MSNEKDNNRELFLKSLDYHMKKSEMRPADLARLTGLTRGRVSEILSGKYKPGFKIQTKIAEVFSLNLYDFILDGQLEKTKTMLLNTGRDLFEKAEQIRGYGLLFEKIGNNEWLSSIMDDLFNLDEKGQKAISSVLEALKSKNEATIEAQTPLLSALTPPTYDKAEDLITAAGKVDIPEEEFSALIDALRSKYGKLPDASDASDFLHQWVTDNYPKSTPGLFSLALSIRYLNYIQDLTKCREKG